MAEHELKFIDLCCGIGGFHQALIKMGMKCVMAADIDKYCRENYELNYGIRPEGDFTKIDASDIPAFDVLCAGFPCQPFSKAGAQSGFGDQRGNIFFDICRIVKHHKPKYLVLENVRNLATHDKGNTWSVIRRKIDELGYHTYDDPVIVNTLYFGVPQSRERVVIMCKRKDMGEMEELPTFTKKSCDLASIIESTCDPKYNITGKLSVTHDVWDEFIHILNDNGISVPKFPLWTDWWDSDGDNTSVTKYDKKKTDEENQELVTAAQHAFYGKYTNWIDKNREFFEQNNAILAPWLEKSRKQPLWAGAVRKMEWQTGRDNVDMSQVLWSPRGSGVRIKNTDYSPTLVAMASMIPIYGPKKRQLTPRECARLQSFPETYKIHETDKIAYKQFGNAVNVTMIEKCTRFLIFNEKP